ncbi:MAG: 8-oxoguanine deaminase [Jatrophihabitans sp.]
MISLQGGYLATVDEQDNEYPDSRLVIDGNRIAAVGAGAAAREYREAVPVDVRGRLVTPGLVNAHHHLYQWITRGYAPDATLFGWLSTLYPIWSRLTPELLLSSAAANLAWLALTGCTTSTDHHYVFPGDSAALLAVEIEAARKIGLRFHPCRGSMNLGASAGGLPPDSVVEGHDAVLSATAAAIDRWHDPGFDSMLRVAVAPCSPFSVTAELMRDCAELARLKGVRLHTHLAETLDEDRFCRQTYQRSPVEYADDLGWLGPDVWLAHCVHLSPAAITRLATSGTSVAHCPTSNGRLGAGIAPVPALHAAGVPVGLGVDGAASNESGRMSGELHQAMLTARSAHGPQALGARQALRMATIGGARCLGRQDELGSLQAGKLADLAVWKLTGLAASGIADPVTALVFGTPELDRLYVNGRLVVADGVLQTADQDELAADALRASIAIVGR